MVKRFLLNKSSLWGENKCFGKSLASLAISPPVNNKLLLLMWRESGKFDAFGEDNNKFGCETGVFAAVDNDDDAARLILLSEALVGVVASKLVFDEEDEELRCCFCCCCK